MADIHNSLKKLSVKNFTVFSDQTFEFAPSLNLIVGANGTGKTHVLKLIYSIVNAMADQDEQKRGTKPTKEFLEKKIATELIDSFRPDQLGRLIRRQPGRSRCDVSARFTLLRMVNFSFNSTSKKTVNLDRLPLKWVEKLPVYLPTRELLTFCPWFLPLYETTNIPLSSIYRDTCLLLAAPLARGPRLQQINTLLEPIEKTMGGKVESDKTGRFYLRNDSGQMEMSLVAEGHRKLAMLARLIATGQLIQKGFLFWDEPEANLNPAVIKQVARTILDLCRSGIQVFIATHSLFLMRELDILMRSEEYADTPARFFGLHAGDAGVQVDQGDTIDDIGEIVSLQEELVQTDEYLQWEVGDGGS